MLLDTSNSSLGSPSFLGAKTTNAIASASNTLNTVSAALGLLKGLGVDEIYNRTLGAVFQNGFNLKCWGSSWNPTKAKAVFAEISPTIIDKAQWVLRQDVKNLEKHVNDFWVFFYGFKPQERHWLETSAKDCTKDGLKLLISLLTDLRDQIRTAFEMHAEENGYEITQVAPKYVNFPPWSNGDHGYPNFPIDQFEVTGSGNATFVDDAIGKVNEVTQSNFGLIIGGLFVALLFFGKRLKLFR